MSTPTPVAILTWCPRCDFQHIDRDEWATRPHRTHLCGNCDHEWAPLPYPTVGVLTLEGVWPKPAI